MITPDTSTIVKAADTSCPITGLDIASEPAWTNIKLGHRYSASFAVIGGHILHSAPRGNAGNLGIPRFMEARERVLRQAGLWNRPHVEIKDYGVVAEDHPRLGRVQFTLAMAAEHRRGMLKGFWAYNGPDSFRSILNVAKRLVRHKGIPVMFVADYEAAVLHALDALGQNRIQMSRAWRDELDTREEWQLELSELTALAGCIGKDILYAELRGRMCDRHVDRVHALGRRVLAEPSFFPNGGAYRVFNLEALEGITWRARRAWLGLVHEQQVKNSCLLLVMVGLNRIMGAAARMSRPIFNGPVALARDMDEALELIQRHRVNAAVKGMAREEAWRVPRVYSEEQVRRQADDLLRYMGAINWDLPGLDQSPCDEENPLHDLYEAVAVIKHDFDTMVSEKAEMQARVFRAAKVASLGTLAAGFAHELNNPLTAVLGFAQRIQEVGAEEPILRYGEIIERAAQRMSKVVNQLGEYCREPNLAQEQPADLNRAVTAVMELFGPVIRRQNIEMEMDLDPELPRLLADPGHLMSLVQNLVTNARDALLELKGEADRRIAIRTWSEPRWVWISVADSGLGMPEDVRDKAFDPFYTTKEVGKGTGLGLYVVHRIVDQYNGSIAIHTDKGQGTRIELQFPALTVQEA